MAQTQKFTEIDRSLFERCKQEMKYDEFMFTDDFNSKSAMSSLEVGGPRLDAHLMAAGHYSVADIQKHTELLDSNLTNEQIFGICGKFFDLQISRIQGYCLLTNILTSCYIQKDYEVQHPLLNFLFKLFSHVSYKIEKFTFDHRVNASFWSFNKDYQQFLTLQDEAELQNEYSQLFIPDELKGLIEFEFNLSRLIDNPHKAVMNESINIPEATNDIGLDKFLHYRDAPPSTPPAKQQIPSHEKAIAIAKHFVKEINQLSEVIPGELRIVDLVSRISDWNEASDHVALTRFILISRILDYDPNQPEDAPKSQFDFFHLIDATTYIRNELTPFNVHPKFFTGPKYAAFVDSFKSIFSTFVKHLVLPIPTAHAYFSEEGVRYFSYLQSLAYEAFQTSVKEADLPKCVNKDHQKAASMIIAYWSTQIASEVLVKHYRWGYKSNVYSLKDIHITLYAMQTAARMAIISYSQSRIACGVYRVKNSKKNVKTWHRKEADVNRLIPEPSLHELYYLALEELFASCFKIARLAKEWNSFDKLDNGLFFNEEFVFKSRTAVSGHLLHFNTLAYDDFLKDMSTKPFTEKPEILISEASKSFQSAKEALQRYMKASGVINVEIQQMLRCIVTNSLFLRNFNPNVKIRVSYENHFLWPIFEVVENPKS